MPAGSKDANLRASPYRALLLATAGMVALATTASAQTVTLVSPSGGVELTGRLVSYQDDAYTLETMFGTISVSTDRVQCMGSACPKAEAAPTDGTITIVGVDRLGARAASGLVEGYASSLGGVAAAQDMSDGTLWRGLTTTDDPPLFSAEVRDLSRAGPLDAVMNERFDLAITAIPPVGRRTSNEDANVIGHLLDAGSATTIGVQGVQLIVHPRNRIDNLTPEEVSALLTGRIGNWSMLGGADMQVRVVAQPQGGLVGAILRERFLNGGTLTMDSDSRILADDEAVAAEVAETPGAIGFVGLEGDEPAKPVGITVACGLTPDPGAFSAKTGEYPLHHRLTLFGPDDSTAGHAGAIRRYALSDKANDTIEQLGLIDMSVLRHDQLTAALPVRAAIDISPDERQVNLLRELYIDMLEWDRLSATFRFDPGEPLALAPGSNLELERLGAYLRRLPAGTDIAFVGFTNSTGTFDERLRRSQFRADVVLSALAEQVDAAALRHIRIQSKGFADLKPVGCFAEERGRSLNRRVEVWVKR